MTKSTVSIEIEASPEKVFAFITSEKINDVYKEWIEIKWASDGPVGVNSIAHCVGMGRQKGADWDIKVTEFVKDKKITMRSMRSKESSKLALNSTNSFALEPTTKGTKVSYSIEYEMPWSVLGELIDELMVKRGAEKQNNKLLENLKALET